MQLTERLKAIRARADNASNAPEFPLVIEALSLAIHALKDYASIHGGPINWPNRDACTYLEDPARHALAKIERLFEGDK